MTRARELAEPRWTEGVCGDGVVILRDGVMVRITELLKILNNYEAALSHERAEAIEAAARECDDARAVNSRALSPPTEPGPEVALARLFAAHWRDIPYGMLFPDFVDEFADLTPLGKAAIALASAARDEK